ncbi:Hsp70 family protein [Pseudoduganella umbonata]|uniref:Molecular chaperone DnaK n=1 Tax=Pseudoduganella umbonata TaxID=864828 RepID=A0A4P8HN64_9BURK|nr:Hsp70 family protein [Pseudoduganella umbonata]MBB3224819.1 molecular chaperone DnaK (HSP70) [Pseudoduganella umbonata]QCP11123.1 molecular chaperone DnaK [Pseudoduganella umbonata]
MTPYLVSIDLGTTNTVLAYAAPGASEVQLLDIDQLTAPGEVHGALLLPSSRYHPAEGELGPAELQLPWLQADVAGVERFVVGRLARTLGAQVTGRYVASAKSWLSHPGVDRTAPILPWGAPDGVPKVSPVAASASYLAHLRGAWNARFPDHLLEDQRIVLTVPASFDEGARALTLEAAKLAGLHGVRLLEEPQAALYDWLYRHRATLAAELADTRLALVADVGGGTTDFSLVQVRVANGEPVLERIGVGNHLILGGDNMDLALAHLAESRLAPPDSQQRLSAGRLAQLTERCRAAKEQLLAAGGPEQANVTLLGSGSKLIGGSRSVTLTRADVAQIVVEGFFPLNQEQADARRARGAIVEFGLPYASDAAVTRHLASFLRQHGQAARAALGIADDTTFPVPDTLLLNGGVFRADALAQRLAATLDGWRGLQQLGPVKVLHNDNPDVAVARGGVAYSLSRQGMAPSIAGGSARAYYLLLDADKAPGVKRRAVCILPRGAQPGSEVTLADRTFGLRVGRPVRFHLVSTVTDLRHGAGDLADLDPADYVALPAISTVLKTDDTKMPKEIPVRLAAALSEVGTLEVHCVEAASGRRWLLEFQLRGEEEQAAEPQDNAPPPRFADAVEKIERIFGARVLPVESKDVRQLRGQLEQLLGSRERWPTALLRHLFDALMARAKGRRRSAEHERVWLNLAGWCLRPGFGAPLDDWRIGQLWALFGSGAQYFKDSQVRAEWWTLWRRVAGGLSTDMQLRLLDDFAFNLQATAAERGTRPATLVDGSEEDMLRLGASLERIPAAYKAEIGDWMVGTIGKLPASGPKFDAKAAASFTRYLWALGRVGARKPFHGSAHEVAPVASVEGWLGAILKLDWKKIEPAGFAAAHLARMTGDRSRDINPALREEILRRLTGVGAPPTWSAMVRDVVELDQASEQRMFGDALPPGLKLIS